MADAKQEKLSVEQRAVISQSFESFSEQYLDSLGEIEQEDPTGTGSDFKDLLSLAQLGLSANVPIGNRALEIGNTAFTGKITSTGEVTRDDQINALALAKVHLVARKPDAAIALMASNQIFPNSDIFGVPHMEERVEVLLNAAQIQPRKNRTIQAAERIVQQAVREEEKRDAKSIRRRQVEERGKWIDPGIVNATCSVAEAWFRVGRKENAESALQRAETYIVGADLSSGSSIDNVVEAQTRLMQTQVHIGRQEQVGTRLQEILAVFPQDTFTSAQHVTHLLQETRQTPDTLGISEEYHQASETFAKTIEAFMKVAKQAHTLGFRQQAITSLDMAATALTQYTSLINNGVTRFHLHNELAELYIEFAEATSVPETSTRLKEQAMTFARSSMTLALGYTQETMEREQEHFSGFIETDLLETAFTTADKIAEAQLTTDLLQQYQEFVVNHPHQELQIQLQDMKAYQAAKAGNFSEATAAFAEAVHDARDFVKHGKFILFKMVQQALQKGSLPKQIATVEQVFSTEDIDFVYDEIIDAILEEGYQTFPNALHLALARKLDEKSRAIKSTRREQLGTVSYENTRNLEVNDLLLLKNSGLRRVRDENNRHNALIEQQALLLASEGKTDEAIQFIQTESFPEQLNMKRTYYTLAKTLGSLMTEG